MTVPTLVIHPPSVEVQGGEDTWGRDGRVTVTRDDRFCVWSFGFQLARVRRGRSPGLRPRRRKSDTSGPPGSVFSNPPRSREEKGGRGSDRSGTTGTGTTGGDQ